MLTIVHTQMKKKPTQACLHRENILSQHITFSQAINQAMHEAMTEDENVICYGLGVNDPKAIFGTTEGLENAFGKQRVFDMPTSENAMTGVAIGAALNGLRPVMVHQRLDFFLLAMDQLVNSAAKWRFMFGGNTKVPICIRLIIGRGWGQGPTHSQSLQAWFAHIPGLKVVMPTTAEDAKGLLMSSIFDDNPVIFLEHRWLHQAIGDVPFGPLRVPIGKARTARNGTDVTVIAMSYMAVEAIYAADHLAKNGIYCDVIDLRTISPLDWEAIFESTKKTGRVLVLDTGHANGSVAGEIIARICMEFWGHLKCPPKRIAMPDFPEATSYALTKGYHPRAINIMEVVLGMVNKKMDLSDAIELKNLPHDVPGDWFKGPF